MKSLALFVCSLIASVILLSISITTTITIGEQKQRQQQEQNFAYAESSTSSSLIPDFNFAAAGDWGCTDHTEETVNNILNKSPELVLALGDYAYVEILLFVGLR
jgi:hypothetical protein